MTQVLKQVCGLICPASFSRTTKLQITGVLSEARITLLQKLPELKTTTNTAVEVQCKVWVMQLQ
jgi:hypothetical protein